MVREKMPNKIARYGWKPDIPDQRDYKLPKLGMLGGMVARYMVLPAKVDLRLGQMPPIYDQGSLGSCTANASGAALQFDQMKQGRLNFIPSRLFIYYEERVLEGTVNVDSGGYLRDAAKVCATKGGPKEDLWPYDISKFTVKPPQAAYDDGMLHQSTLYLRVNRSLTDFKKCLYEGFPFFFGFTVYERFESAEMASTGILYMPIATEQRVGGHAVLVVGYDNSLYGGVGGWIVRNSWGTAWGQAGYFTMPYNYLLRTDLSSDFWTIRSVE
jgi:C1A family cysteine protease